MIFTALSFNGLFTAYLIYEEVLSVILYETYVRFLTQFQICFSKFTLSKYIKSISNKFEVSFLLKLQDIGQKS